MSESYTPVGYPASKEANFHMGQRLTAMTNKVKALKGYKYDRTLIDELIQEGVFKSINNFYYMRRSSDISTKVIKAYKTLYGIHPAEWFEGM